VTPTSAAAGFATSVDGADDPLPVREAHDDVQVPSFLRLGRDLEILAIDLGDDGPPVRRASLDLQRELGQPAEGTNSDLLCSIGSIEVGGRRAEQHVLDGE
jgi:hypothetical protein